MAYQKAVQPNTTAAIQQQATNTPKNRPEAKFRAGSVTTTVWRNTGKKADGTEFNFLSVQLARNYVDANQQWQQTDSLRTNDVPRAILALQRAWDYINSEKAKEEEQ